MRSGWTALAIVILAMAMASVTAGQETTAIPLGSSWRYLDDGSDQGTAWKEPEFDDSAWSTGPAQLGYGDGDEATVVSFGDDPTSHFVTTYFRHTFAAEDPGSCRGIRGRLVRDDGAVVWLNGTEVFRSNMTNGAINHATFAARGVSGAEESLPRAFSIDPGLLVDGDNIVAVEIHRIPGVDSDISFDLELALAQQTFVSRGPYLQSAAPDRITVRWRTSFPEASRVLYGPSPDALESEAVVDGERTEHEVMLAPLDPATVYHYAVATATSVLAGEDADHRFRTPPVPDAPVPVRIWAIGDSGTANQASRAVRNAFEQFAGPRIEDIWLMLGDNAYQYGSDFDYTAGVFETYPKQLRRSTLWPTFGNHDGYSASSAAQTGPYYHIFSLPKNGECGGVPSGTEAYYSFDHANIHFVCLDSFGSLRTTAGPMLSWLADDLAVNEREWLIAYWHHPPYTKGSHDSDVEGELIDMRANALPILEMHGVDLVLTGHSHSYERSFLIDGHYGVSPTLTPWMKRNDGDGRENGDGIYRKPPVDRAPHSGAVYAVAGSSGLTSGGPLDHPAMFVSLNVLGSLVIDVEGNRLDAQFVDSAGAVADSFTIVKEPPPPQDGTMWSVK